MFGAAPEAITDEAATEAVVVAPLGWACCGLEGVALDVEGSEDVIDPRQEKNKETNQQKKQAHTHTHTHSHTSSIHIREYINIYIYI